MEIERCIWQPHLRTREMIDFNSNDSLALIDQRFCDDGIANTLENQGLPISLSHYLSYLNRGRINYFRNRQCENFLLYISRPVLYRSTCLDDDIVCAKKRHKIIMKSKVLPRLRDQKDLIFNGTKNLIKNNINILFLELKSKHQLDTRIVDNIFSYL